MSKTIYLKTSLYSGPVSKHPLYSTWVGITNRCYNRGHIAYKRYGGAGITMLYEWVETTEKFLIWIDENLGSRPVGFTLDRIDPFGGYFPDNLRWADKKTQANNIRNPEEKARKVSEGNTGKKRSEEHLRQMSEARTGKMSGENNPAFGKPSWNSGKTGIYNVEVLQNMSEAAKKRQKKTCSHCGKVCDVSNYARWHGLNCPKLKETTEQLWNAWYSEFINQKTEIPV